MGSRNKVLLLEGAIIAAIDELRDIAKKDNIKEMGSNVKAVADKLERMLGIIE